MVTEHKKRAMMLAGAGASLEQRVAAVEAAVDEAPTSRLLILPVNQAGDQQEEPQ